MTQDNQPKLLFPWKLHHLLDESLEKGHGDIISWTNFGRSFRVHDKERFTASVMPLYFDTGKFKSFQRSLNLWGFRTVTRGKCKGDCSHPYFMRGQPDLCVGMQRVRVRKDLSKAPKPPATSQNGLLAMRIASVQGQLVSPKSNSPTLASRSPSAPIDGFEMKFFEALNGGKKNTSRLQITPTVAPMPMLAASIPLISNGMKFQQDQLQAMQLFQSLVTKKKEELMINLAHTILTGSAQVNNRF